MSALRCGCHPRTGKGRGGLFMPQLANADTGHTGVFEAAVAACEAHGYLRRRCGEHRHQPRL